MGLPLLIAVLFLLEEVVILTYRGLNICTGRNTRNGQANTECHYLIIWCVNKPELQKSSSFWTLVNIWAMFVQQAGKNPVPSSLHLLVFCLWFKSGDLSVTDRMSFLSLAVCDKMGSKDLTRKSI